MKPLCCLVAIVASLLSASISAGVELVRTQVVGGTVSMRGSDGWSYDLTLWEVRDADRELVQFRLIGWATGPDLQTMPMDIRMLPSFIAARHGGWELAADGRSGTAPDHPATFRVSHAFEDRARIELQGVEPAAFSIAASPAYRAALGAVEGVDANGPAVVFDFALAAIFANIGDDENFITASQCRTWAREDCVRQCPGDPTTKVCISWFTYDPETGYCSYGCKTVAECCPADPSPNP